MTSLAPSSTPAVGDRAPDFTLASTSGQPVTLSSFVGRKSVLLAFFPLAFTSTCTTELCAFTEDFERFDGHDVEVLPISVDSAPTLTEFKHRHAMKVDLLSDFKREASRAYGTLWQDAYFSNRAYFLVDKTGTVRWVHVEENPGQRRENHELLEQIAKIA